MVKLLNKKLLNFYILKLLILSAFVQTTVIYLLLIINAKTCWILLIPVSQLVLIPFLYNKFCRHLVCLRRLLEDKSIKELKEASYSEDEFGNLAYAAYKILKNKELVKSDKNTCDNVPSADKVSGNTNYQFYNLESLSKLAGGIAHDFNNILGAISGYAEIILSRYTEDPKLQKYGKNILSATNKATDLSQKLLQFARKSKFNMSYFDVNIQLSGLIDIFSDSLSNQITMTCQFDAQDSFVYGDVDQFHNVITNLAINAQEAMPNGGTLVFKTENISINQNISSSNLFTIIPGYYISITVSDSGLGMKQDELSHIFEPFFTTKEKTKSSGLALASVYGTIKSHNGFVDVKSAPNEGTIFAIYLPVVKQQSPDSRPVFTCPINKKIFLIDDEEIIQDAVGEMLKWLGFDVTIASNGNEAIEIFKKSPAGFDLIILDMMMPGIDGKECFFQLRNINPDIKVLICSGYSTDIDRQKLIDEGAAGILIKPFVSSQLTKTICDILNQN